MAQRKTNGKEGEEEYEARLVIETEMYKHGASQAAIGDAVGVSQRQVSYDLTVIKRRLRKELKRNLQDARALQIARLEEIYGEAYQAWQLSKEDEVITFTEQANSQPALSSEKPVDHPANVTPLHPDKEKGQPDTSKKPGQVRTKTYIRRKAQTGNPAYLDKMLRSIEQHRKIEGTDEPQQVHFEGTTVSVGLKAEDLSRAQFDLQKFMLARGIDITAALADVQKGSEDAADA